jgi:hypothetical protein
MKTYAEVDLQIRIYLTSTLSGGDWLHKPATLPPEKEPQVPIV